MRSRSSVVFATSQFLLYEEDCDARCFTTQVLRDASEFLNFRWSGTERIANETAIRRGLVVSHCG